MGKSTLYFCGNEYIVKNAVNQFVLIFAEVSVGSGFAAFEEGVIITNYHVIEDYPSRIEIETETGQTCDIFGGIGVAKERDIAILY